MSIAIKRLERAIGDLPKGGMQTGNHKVKLDLADAERLIAELNALQADRDALAAQVEALSGHRHELLDLIYNNAIGEVAMGYAIDGSMMANHAYAITGIDAASVTNSTPPQAPECLAAHDAEVAAKAIEDAANRLMCGWVIKYDDLLEYADELRTKTK